MPLDRRDFRLLFVCCAIVVAGLAVFTGIVENAIPGDRVFSGFLINNLDGWSYRAYANYYRHSGGVAIDNPWAVERHPPAYINLMWFLVGRLMAVGIPFRVCWHALQGIGSCLLLVSLLALIRRLTPDRVTAWTAFLLCAFGTGFGWLQTLVNPTTVFYPLGRHKSFDLSQTDAFPFMAYWNAPQQPLSWAMSAAILLLMHKAISGEGRRWAVVAGVIALTMGFIRPYHFVTIFPVLISWWLIILHRRGRAGLRYLLDLGILAGGMIPGLVYYGLVIPRTPNFGAVWQVKGFCPPSTLPAILLGYGLFIPLALIGLLESSGRLRHADEGATMVVSWLLLQGLIRFSSVFPFSPHLAVGLLIPLSILAAGGLLGVRRRILARIHPPMTDKGNPDPRELIPWAWIMVLVASVIPSIILVASNQVRGSATDSRSDLPRELCVSISKGNLDAMHFLDREAGSAFPLVFSSDEIGIVLPALAQVRAFANYISCVKDRNRKLFLSRFLYTPGANDRDWITVLKSYPIEYVWWGPDEDVFGASRPPDLPFMKRIFDNDEVTIYRVIRSVL